MFKLSFLLKTTAALLCTLAVVNLSWGQLTTETLVVDGDARSYLLYLPDGHSADQSWPLVMNFHGGSGTAEDQLAVADMRDRADEDGIVLAYPQALPDPNDDGSTNWQVVTSGDLPFTVPNPHSDIDFISDLVDALVANQSVDPSRVYAMGYSNGGGFTYDLACRLNDKITGIGAVARTMYAESLSSCVVTHPTPVVTILGTNDFISNYEGVVYKGTLYYHSSDEGNAHWVEVNGLNPAPEVTLLPNLDASDGSTVEESTWLSDDGCHALHHYKVIGGGHDWPGSFGNGDIVSHELIWDKLKVHDHSGLIGCETSGQAEAETMAKHSVYPNPAMPGQAVVLRNGSPFHEAILLNAAGQKVQHLTFPATTRTELTLSNVPAGLYFVEHGQVRTPLVIH